MPISVTLKQKLSNLALSASSPSTPASSPTSTRRGVFSFARRGDTSNEPTYDQLNAGIDDASIDEIMQRVIRQAGVDYETRPMVVITAAEFPDPRYLSYDLLFQRVLRHLDLYVESDYTVVFLVAGGKFQPGWSWVWKSYRSLNRKYRKNLKKLYIVHTTVFSKMLFSLAGTIVSPKFFRKIQYIPTLSALATVVPLTNLDLHPAVYRENLKHERQIVLPGAQNAPSQMFGVSLDMLMGEDGQSSGIPRAVKDCVEYIRARGLETEGLFRRSPNSAMLRHAKEAYDRGQPVSLSSFGDPHVAAVLLKKFFRDLPRPVFPETMYSAIQACPLPSSDPADRTCVDYIRDSILPLVENTSPPTLIVFSYVLHLLHDISIRSTVNLMDATNLALCFAPNLVSGSSIIRDTQFCSIPNISLTTSSLASASISSTRSERGEMTLGILIRACIEQYFEIFEEIPDRTTAISTHPSLAFSDTTSSPKITSSTSYGTPRERISLEERLARRLNTPPPRHPSLTTRGPISPLSPESNESFTTAEDSDSDPDESMLIMPIGPSASAPSPHSPPSAWGTGSPSRVSATSRTIGVGHPSSPLSHRRKESAMSGGSASSARGAAQSTNEPGGGRSTLRPARSIISIERAASGVGSIRIGRSGSGGTRRVSGSGVEAIGVTAAGFFAPVNGDSSSAANAKGA